MGGMILKDFIFMKKQIKFYLLVIGIYCFLCFYWDQPSLVVTMACVLSIMFPVQIFGWDESCNWQMMERILPVSSGKVVLARYPVSYTHLDVYKRQGCGILSFMRYPPSAMPDLTCSASFRRVHR